MTTPPTPDRSGRPERPRAAELWTLGAILVAAALLRFVTLSTSSYWLDEAYTVDAVNHGFTGVWDAVRTTESTPPLYYELAWGWTRVFGISEWGLRSLSAVSGTALVGVVWLAGRELFSRRGALVAAALTATSPLLVWFSQEARAYELAVLLCTVAFWLFLRARRGERHALIWWAVVGALALTAHYVAAFPVAVEGALLVWRHRTRAAAIAVGVVGVALLPLIATQRGNALAGTVRDGSAPFRLAQIPKQFADGFDGPAEVPLAVIGLLFGLGGLVLLFTAAGPRSRRGGWLCMAVSFASLAGPLLLLLAGQDQVLTRYVLPGLPLVLLLIAGGFGARAAWPWGLFGAAGVITVGLVAIIGVAVTPTDRTREDWRGAAAVLDDRVPPIRPRAIVVSPASGQRPLALYVDGLSAPAGPTVRVREIDLVDPGLGRNHHVDRAGAARLAIDPSFRLVVDVRSDTVTARRYVAPVAKDVPVAALVGAQATGHPGAVLVQR